MLCASACVGRKNSGTPGPQDPRTPGPQDPRTPAAGRAGVLGSWGPGVLGSWGPGVIGCSGPGLLGSWPREHRRALLPTFRWRPVCCTQQCDGARLAARCCLMDHQAARQHVTTLDLTGAWPHVQAGAYVRAPARRSRESPGPLHHPAAVARHGVCFDPRAPVDGTICSLTGLSRRPYGYWPYALTN